jgi:hypothetical protein
VEAGPFTMQQSCPTPQQEVPQQNCCELQFVPPPEQTGELHVPLLQNGCSPVHLRPHVPQLLMSLSSATHVLPQQVRPRSHRGTHLLLPSGPASLLPPLESRPASVACAAERPPHATRIKPRNKNRLLFMRRIADVLPVTSASASSRFRRCCSSSRGSWRRPRCPLG